MKKLMIFFIFCFISISLLATEIKEKEFKITFSITFDSMTLKKAANTEKKISELFKNAEVDIEISKKIEEGNIWYYNSGMPNTKIRIIEE